MPQRAAIAAAQSRGVFGVESPEPRIAALLAELDVSALADVAEIPRKRFYRYRTAPGNGSGEGRQLPLALSPALEIATGSTVLVDWHAAALGGVFVRPARLPLTVTGVVAHLATMGTEFADVQRRSADMLRDRRVTPAEARAVLAEVREHMRAVIEYEMELEAELLRKPLASAGAR